MNYTNRACRSCGEKFKEDDDIVVCPECATPHHRECWKANGQCANAALHGTDYVWTNEKLSEQLGKEEPEPEAHQSPAPENSVCHICGSENPADSLHCGSCGALLNEPEKEGVKITCQFCGTENPANVFSCKECGAPLMLSQSENENPYMAGTGIAEDELIGTTKAGDLARYVQNGAKNYLPKFKKLADGKKAAFNWAAFFLAPYWFFYRKLYKIGIFFAVLFVSVSMLTIGVQQKVFNAMEEYYAAIDSVEYSNPEEITQEDLAVVEKASEDLLQKAAPYEAILLAVSVAERLICALVANRFYYKKATEDIAQVYSSTDSSALQKLMIMRRGGTSLIALFTCFLGMQVLTDALIYIANLFM